MFAFPFNLAGLFVIVLLLTGMLDVGTAFFDQTISNGILEASVNAAAEQSGGVQGINGQQVAVLSPSPIPQTAGNVVWSSNIQLWGNGPWDQQQPQYTFSTQNPNTPSGYYDTVQASVHESIPMQGSSNLMSAMGIKETIQNTVTDTFTAQAQMTS